MQADFGAQQNPLFVDYMRHKCSKFSVDILRLAKATFGIKSEAEEEKTKLQCY